MGTSGRTSNTSLPSMFAENLCVYPSALLLRRKIAAADAKELERIALVKQLTGDKRVQ
jgi:hypothetical protein